jgi:hypothetical protein
VTQRSAKRSCGSDQNPEPRPAAWLDHIDPRCRGCCYRSPAGTRCRKRSTHARRNGIYCAEHARQIDEAAPSGRALAEDPDALEAGLGDRMLALTEAAAQWLQTSSKGRKALSTKEAHKCVEANLARGRGDGARPPFAASLAWQRLRELAGGDPDVQPPAGTRVAPTAIRDDLEKILSAARAALRSPAIACLEDLQFPPDSDTAQASAAAAELPDLEVEELEEGSTDVASILAEAPALHRPTFRQALQDVVDLAEEYQPALAVLVKGGAPRKTATDTAVLALAYCWWLATNHTPMPSRNDGGHFCRWGAATLKRLRSDLAAGLDGVNPFSQALRRWIARDDASRLQLSWTPRDVAKTPQEEARFCAS